jgi:hypothetical protein
MIAADVLTTPAFPDAPLSTFCASMLLFVNPKRTILPNEADVFSGRVDGPLQGQSRASSLARCER